MRAKTNRQSLCFVIFLYYFILKDYLESVILPLKFSDEIIALCAIPVFLFQLRRNSFRLKVSKTGYGVWVALFLLLSFMGSVIYHYQPFLRNALPDLLLCCKFWLVLYVGQHLFKGFSMERHAKGILFHVQLISTVYTLLILLDWKFHIFEANMRYGLRSVQLFYNHPTLFAASCALLSVICLALRNAHPKARKCFVWTTVLMCSTLRSKAIAVALIFWFIYYLVFIRKKKLKISTFLVLVPIAILIAWDQIQYYFFSSIQSDSARFHLLTKSVMIANDHFPLGSGLGTFGSYSSTTTYSPLYSLYGISDVNGLREGAALFASDNFWPMIIAQSGWIGAASYLAALLFLFLRIQKLRKISFAYYVSALSILVYLLVSSTAESAFVHPYAIPLAIWLGYLFSHSKRSQYTCPKRSSTAP